jgi:hypothetical protein
MQNLFRIIVGTEKHFFHISRRIAAPRLRPPRPILGMTGISIEIRSIGAALAGYSYGRVG